MGALLPCFETAALPPKQRNIIGNGKKGFCLVVFRRFLRQMRAIRPALVAIAAGAALVLQSCAKREAPVTQAIATQTLLLGNAAEPADLDPQNAAVLNDQIVTLALFEGLTWLEEE